MKPTRFILLAGITFLLAACQQKSSLVTIFADGQIFSLRNTRGTPADLLAVAGITLGRDDRVLSLGRPIPLELALPDSKPCTITVRRAVAMTIFAPDGQQTIQTSALTVGEALAEAGFRLYTTDRIDPPAETPVRDGMSAIVQPGREIVVTMDGTQVRVRSAANTVGQALAETGIPLIGLDTSHPGESAPLPEDGRIRVVRRVESVALIQKTIPFSTRSELSADLEIDQQALLQGGESGLAITRLRTRSENGVKVSQVSESESVVRPPLDEILGIGTKIVIRTAVVDGVSIEYYRALQLMTTSYSPCQSATLDGRCSYGTSSGLPVQRGTVAMVYTWYLAFGYDKLYIPGYGYATVGDVGGGYPPGNHYWVDLAWTDAEYQPMMGWTTVYFLTPVPQNLVYVLP